MSIASFLEKIVVGDKNIKRDMQKMGDFGAAEYGRGSAISDEGLDRIRGGIGDIEGSLASGNVLPAGVQRAYGLARGRIADETARSIDASAAGIAQRRRQAGGMMSGEGSEEYRRIAEREARDREFGAMTDVGASEAGAELTQYNKLFERLDSLRGTILNAGEFLQQVGQHEKIHGMLSRVDRAKSVTMSGTSSANTAMATYGKGG